MSDVSIVYKKLTEIRPYENNPRKNEQAVDKVAESISRFGFKVPIVIDDNGIIVAGHTRMKAAEKLGLEEVPCIIASDLTEQQIKAFRLADNKVGSFSTWDFVQLSEEMDSLGDYDMAGLGFEVMDFDDLERLLTAKQPEPQTIKCPYCGTEFEV